MKVKLITGQQIPWLEGIKVNSKSDLTVEDFRKIQAGEIVDVDPILGIYLVGHKWCEEVD